MEEARKQTEDLVERFQRNIDVYKNGKYNETQVRREFIDPFFDALGWDVANKAGYAEQYKDVVHEDSVKVGISLKAPDYSFRIGGQRKFFLEAKKPSVRIKEEVPPAFQLRRYGWSAKLPLSILTDFEELAVYDCRTKPTTKDKVSTGRVAYYTYDQYIDKFDELWGTFSKEAVLKGSFDRYAVSSKGKRGTGEVDREFLKEIETWRDALARNLAIRNRSLTVHELNFAVQHTIDRIIFLRICEDRGIENYGRLQALTNGANAYPRLLQLFTEADARYNSGLFDFKADTLSHTLNIDDKVLQGIIENLYYPKSPYEFSVLGADILGNVYEQFLGKVIRLTAGHQAKVEEKPEVKKAGGVYYTPQYIVEYIVQNTVGKLLGAQGSVGADPRVCPDEGKEKGAHMGAPLQKSITPKQASTLRILDPACGSGSFLIGAYQYLLDWHLKWYEENDPEKHARGKEPAIYKGAGAEWKLTTKEKKRILLNNIYGVDIDRQAVEVTKLSLLLKVLEDENQETLNLSFTFMQKNERVLPNLDDNIKCGNSLIGPDFYDQQDLFPTLEKGGKGGFDPYKLNDDDMRRINVFDWEKEFPKIFPSPLRGEGQGGGENGFDAVVGNPPYIRIQAMKEWAPLEVEEYKQSYKAASKGNYDIYVVFVEKGLSLLNSKGLLGYILPHKFFQSQYGAPVRQIISEGNHLSEVIDFGDKQVFDGATTYTCLLFLGKGGAKEVAYTKVSDLKTWEDHVGAGSKPAQEEFMQCGTIPAEKVTAEPWNFVVGKGAKLFDRLSKMPVKLGDVAARIFQGIIPGADKVYALDLLYEKDEKTAVCFSRALNCEVELDTLLLRKIVSGMHVKPYHLHANNSRVIYPYYASDDGSYKLIPNRELQEKYKLTFNYFNETRTLLDARDKGSAKGTEWYKYIRTQNIGLQAFPKIAVPRLVSKLCCAYDIEGEYCLDNVDVGGILIKADCTISPDFLMGLLNSKLLDTYFKNIAVPFRGGFFSANRQYIENLPIPTIDFNNPAEKEKHDQMVALVEQMLDLNKKLQTAKIAQDKELIERQIKITDNQIDRLVYALYRLTEDEIKVVEG